LYYPKSLYHNVYKALVKSHFELAITNEVLLEYQEVLKEK